MRELRTTALRYAVVRTLIAVVLFLLGGCRVERPEINATSSSVAATPSGPAAPAAVVASASVGAPASASAAPERKGALAGPRCLPSTDGCGPFPYLERSEDPRQLRTGEFALAYDPALPRRVVTHSGSESLGGECHHDGECGPSGGRSTCAAWYLAGPPGGSHVLYTEMFDDYCGCVHDRCAWFTPERPAFLVESHVSVKGWGEPKQQNPKRFEVGYGTGEEVVKARLENRWMRRQLERCYLGHADVLPQALSVSFTISPDGKLGGRRIQGADAKVRACVDEVFGWVEFPSRRDGSLVHNGTTPAMVTGTLELRLAGTAP